MVRLLAALDTIASSPSPVLIRGERGCGKEYLARKIHEHRSDAVSFCSVKCRNFDPSMLKDLDNETTFFLDGLHLLDLDSQRSLLDYLMATPLGKGPKIIASATTEIDELFESGHFKRDLLIFLDMISVTCPPLRERKEDIIPLSCSFLEELAFEMNRNVNGFSPAALQRLEAYHWPGNLRELRNVVERALLLCKGSRVEEGDLRLNASSGPVVPEGLELKDAMNYFKRSYIEDSISSSAGNKAEAARRLGIERTYLFKLMHDLGLEL